MGNCLTSHHEPHHRRVRDDADSQTSAANKSKGSNNLDKKNHEEPKVLDSGEGKSLQQHLNKKHGIASPAPTEVTELTSSALSPFSPDGNGSPSPLLLFNAASTSKNTMHDDSGIETSLVVNSNFEHSPFKETSSREQTSTFSQNKPASNAYYTMSIEELNPPESPVLAQKSRSQRRKSSRNRSMQHPAGRALQCRLQRARSMQKILSSSCSIKSRASTLEYASSGDESTTSSLNRRFHRSLSSKYSTISNVSGDSSITGASTHLNGDEIETTISSAAMWAEIEMNDPVLCTCLSRTKASLSKATPPLHIAIGTSGGNVFIQELLNGIDIPLTTAACCGNDIADVNYSKKLGHSLQLSISGKVRSMNFSADGKFLAVGGDAGTCSIYRLEYSSISATTVDGFAVDDVERLTNVNCIAEIHRIDRIYAVQFSPDNVYLAIGGFDGTVAIIATKDFPSALEYNREHFSLIEPITEIPRDGLILTIDWSPDSRYLAIGGSDKCCAIVNVTASWRVFKVIRRAATIQSIQWYPGTGRYLAIGSTDVAIVVGRDSFTTITEIDIRNKDADEQGNSPDPSSSLSDQNQLLSNSSSRRGSPRSINRANAICWSPNGSYIVICGSNRKCTIVETRAFRVVHEMLRSSCATCAVWGEQNQLSATIPRRYLAIGGEDKKVSILKGGIEVSPGMSSVVPDDHSSNYSATSSSYFSSRSDWVLQEGTFHDMADIMEVPLESTLQQKDDSLHGTTNIVVEDTGAMTSSSSNIRVADSGKVVALAFSKGSKGKPSAYFAYSLDDGFVIVRYVSAWKPTAEIQFPTAIQSLTFSSGTTNQFLVLGGLDSIVYVSDTTANYGIITRIVLTSSVTSVIFSKNNERLAAGSLDGTFAFLDPLKNFEYCGEIEVPGNDNFDDTLLSAPASAVLTADWSSKNIAIGREDGTVTVYDSKQVIGDVYESVADIVRKDAVHSVAFGVSSRFLAVGGADRCIGIYSAKGSWVLCHQVEMDSLVTSVRWSPTGRFLAASTNIGTLKVIDTIFWLDVEEACQAASLAFPLQKNAVDAKHLYARPISCLAFSQDGQLLAFARADRGACVLDTASNWNIDFRIPSDFTRTENLGNSNTSASTPVESSSLSSSGEEERNRTLPDYYTSSNDKIAPAYQSHHDASFSDNSRYLSKPDVSFSEDDYYSPVHYDDEQNRPYEV